MDSNAFLNAATSADRWFAHSIALRKSGDTLWDKFISSLLVEGLRHDDTRSAVIADATDYLQTAQLLYALAVETALKGVLIRDHPDQIEFLLTMHGDKQITNVQLKRLGAKMSDGHDLEKLGELAGLVDRNGDRADREILRYLSDCIRWRSRYPIPLANDAHFNPPVDVPTRIFGHYFRDFVDPMLDKLLESTDSPKDTNM